MTGMLFDGRYRIETKLAAGGFGSIYRATFVPTGARVALKVLHPDLASDPSLSARFRREAAVLSSLKDPHTIKTYDHGEAADGTLYIAMELLSGRNLHAELRSQGPLPWWRMLAIMRGVCSSLMEAHALGIVHRDLKPANIHLENRGGNPDFVKVLDFGIVKVLSGSGIDDETDLTRVGQAIGTLEYMAPEQIVGLETDHRTDFYTLGVVAYEMITGRRPFADAAGPAGLMTALITRTPVPPSSLFHRDCFPAAVDRLILRCLANDPAERFADAAELADAIDEILDQTPPSVKASFDAPAAAIGLSATLPGPFLLSRAPGHRSSPPSFGGGSPSLVSIEDGDITSVDTVPLFDSSWEPTLDRAIRGGNRLARTPHLETPPEPPSFKAARGSTVRVSPMQPIPAVQLPQLSALKIATWVVMLLAIGVALGLLVLSVM
jgi:eukaryotic-like serine/threonine-protein kinase